LNENNIKGAYIKGLKPKLKECERNDEESGRKIYCNMFIIEASAVKVQSPTSLRPQREFRKDSEGDL